MSEGYRNQFYIITYQSPGVLMFYKICNECFKVGPGAELRVEPRIL